MIKDLDFDKLENPYVQVVWEDAPENFTQEKLKNVKHYFLTLFKFRNNINTCCVILLLEVMFYIL